MFQLESLWNQVIKFSLLLVETISSDKITTINLTKSFNAKYLKLEAAGNIGISYFSYK